MKKDKKKPRVKLFLTMDAILNEEFESIVVEKCIDKSMLFDTLVKEWIDKNKKQI